jgi:hypothetical protein
MEREAVDPTGFEPAPLSWTGLRATSYTTGPEVRVGRWCVANKAARRVNLVAVPFRNSLYNLKRFIDPKERVLDEARGLPLGIPCTQLFSPHCL